MRIALASDHAGFAPKEHVRGARLAPEAADAIVGASLETPFDGGRHGRRVQQIADMEHARA